MSVGRWAMRVALIAATLLGALIVFAPAQPGVAVYLAAATQARGVYRYDRALHFDALAAAAAPADPGPVCDSADLYARQQVWSAAQAAYRRCVTLAPDDANAWYALGDALAATGDVSGASGALAAWERATTLTGATAIGASATGGVMGRVSGPTGGAYGETGNRLGGALAWRRLAGRAEYARRFAEAADDWRHVVALTSPRSALALEATRHIGLIALEQGDVTDAQSAFLVVFAANGPDAQWLSRFDFSQAAIAAPQTAADYERLGYDYLAAGLPSFALAPLARAIALAPAVGSSRAFLGWAQWTLGLRRTARGEIAQGLRLAPQLSFANFAAGEVAAEDGAPGRALALFTQGLAVDGSNPALWSEAGRMELILGEYVPAAQDMQFAAHYADDPAYSVALLSFYATYHLGLAPNDATGNALAAAITATKRFPMSEQLCYLQGQIYDQAGQQTYAYYAFQRAQALDPTDPGPYLYLGRYAEQDGDYVAAALALRTALALRPTGPLASQAQALLAPLATVAA